MVIKKSNTFNEFYTEKRLSSTRGTLHRCCKIYHLSRICAVYPAYRYPTLREIFFTMGNRVTLDGEVRAAGSESGKLRCHGGK